MPNILNRSIVDLIDVQRVISMQIDITNICNLSCTHCYHPNHKNDGALSLNQWKEILESYFLMAKKIKFKTHIIICGGEPLTSPYLDPILQYILLLDPECSLEILTNGTLINNLKIETLKKFKAVQFQISLDGPNEKIHDSFRGSGNFTRALKGAHFLSINSFEVTFQCTLTKNNSKYLLEFFELARDHKIKTMNFTRLIKTGNAINLTNNKVDDTLNSDELKKAYEMIVILSAKFGILSSTNAPLMNAIHPVLGKRQKFDESIVIDYQGNMLVSSRSRVKMGKVIEEGLENLFFNHPIMKQLRTKKIEGCSDCKHFKFCGGDRNSSYVEYGNFFQKDPGCWITNQIGA
jgi:radical SAM protein with 4Fe4S-binding SPASM domain